MRQISISGLFLVYFYVTFTLGAFFFLQKYSVISFNSKKEMIYVVNLCFKSLKRVDILPIKTFFLKGTAIQNMESDKRQFKEL